MRVCQQHLEVVEVVEVQFTWPGSENGVRDIRIQTGVLAGAYHVGNTLDPRILCVLAGCFEMLQPLFAAAKMRQTQPEPGKALQDRLIIAGVAEPTAIRLLQPVLPYPAVCAVGH